MLKKCAIIILFLLITIQIPTTFAKINTFENKRGSEEIIEMINQVDESMIFNYLSNIVSFGPRYTGSNSCDLAAEYLYEEFYEMGLSVEFHDWDVAGFQSQNVIATLNGNLNPDRIIIICAHYDTTISSPGALDDGSGVAVVLALANIMSNYTFNNTIKFIAFSGEEQGKYGSFCYAKRSYYNQDNIVAVFNLDKLGYGISIEEKTNICISKIDRSIWLEDFAVKINEKYIDEINITLLPSPHYFAGDQIPFLAYGYDATRINCLNHSVPWCHTENDTIDKIDMEYLTNSAKLIIAILAEMGNYEFIIQIIIKTPYEGFIYLGDHPIIDVSTPKFQYSGFIAPTIIFGRAKVRVDIMSESDIEVVYFLIDDKLSGQVESPPFEWRIQGWFFPPIGRHKIVVYAYDVNGFCAKDEMDIFILTLSSYWN